MYHNAWLLLYLFTFRMICILFNKFSSNFFISCFFYWNFHLPTILSTQFDILIYAFLVIHLPIFSNLSTQFLSTRSSNLSTHYSNSSAHLILLLFLCFKDPRFHLYLQYLYYNYFKWVLKLFFLRCYNTIKLAFF